MPELRRDPVVGYWTIISTERSRRPVEYKPVELQEQGDCPFCEGRETETTGEVFAVRKPGSAPNSPGWTVRAIVSKVPILSQDAVFDRFGEGIYDLMEGVGTHEIIIESPSHLHSLDELPASDLEIVIDAYVQRLNELEKDRRFKYALLFKNHGLISGSAKEVMRHTRSQLIATPITPKRVKEELESTRRYFDLHDRCVFCDIIRQEKKDGSRLVHENGSFLAFCPFASRSPFEVWILPKKHMADFGRIPKADYADLAVILRESLTKIKLLLNDPPYNMILHTAPFRHGDKPGYWKSIEEDYHWYLQISPRLTRDAGFEWGTGIYINPTPPEDAAALLRETYASAS
jgi:UDPglucose--hexose-1-phosphate uridylyltransferase